MKAARISRAPGFPIPDRSFLFRWDLEICKQEDEDKTGCRRLKFFNKIPGEEFERLAGTHPVMDNAAKIRAKTILARYSARRFERKDPPSRLPAIRSTKTNIRMTR